ncbi:hypothetical protein [Saccharopolyspora sp. CA-218241]|uniref:hypothetical protein n=1 Tax=Saccharopolyspora sp. CA-218241 TaxID=3240027 RepID=UPI003D9983DE
MASHRARWTWRLALAAVSFGPMRATAWAVGSSHMALEPSRSSRASVASSPAWWAEWSSVSRDVVMARWWQKWSC